MKMVRHGLKFVVSCCNRGKIEKKRVILQKSVEKIWWVSKKSLPLHRFSKEERGATLTTEGAFFLPSSEEPFFERISHTDKVVQERCPSASRLGIG